MFSLRCHDVLYNLACHMFFSYLVINCSRVLLNLEDLFNLKWIGLCVYMCIS